MIPASVNDMRGACHVLAEHVLRSPAKTNRCQWLRQQVADLLKNPEHIFWYAEQYDLEYQYADAPTPYLAEALKAYDQEDN